MRTATSLAISVDLFGSDMISSTSSLISGNQNMSSATLGDFEKAVLLSILNEGDMAYGVRIRQQAEQLTGRPVSIGAVYVTLERLERKKFISSRKGQPTPERGGRAKKFFRIEALGEAALRESMHLMSAFGRALAGGFV